MNKRKRSGKSGGNRPPEPKTATGKRRPPPRNTPSRRSPAKNISYWVYGRHAVQPALNNPNRRIRRIIFAGAEPPDGMLFSAAQREMAESVTPDNLASELPDGAVHQNIALSVDPLAGPHITDIISATKVNPRSVLIVLDQVSDPRNVGAVLRSAAALGAGAVIVPERHAPPETGALARAAAGALEIMPLVRVTNLARTLEALKDAGYWHIGLDADGPTDIGATSLPDRAVLVLGAEGSGLRRLTRENCDMLVRLPMAEQASEGGIDSLNVSVAAALALYEWGRQHR